MAAVGSGAPAHRLTGIDHAGNDIYKALNIWAYHEATEDRILSVGGGRREC